MGRLHAIVERLKHIKRRIKYACEKDTPGGYFSKKHPYACSCPKCRFYKSLDKYRYKPSATDKRRMKADGGD